MTCGGAWLSIDPNGGANIDGIGNPPTIFTATFDIPFGSTITAANMTLAADDQASVSVNGNFLTTAVSFNNCTTPINIPPNLLVNGTNVITFSVIDTCCPPSFGNLIGVN